jgi:hypothetical protein
MSFTTGTLLYTESMTVAKLYVESGDWNQVREIVLADNRLQMRTENASRRIWQEVSSRLKRLTADQLALLLDGSRPEQNLLLWLAVCKRYRFIHDFAADILREKFLRGDLHLSYEKYDAFFYNKAEWHLEVAAVAPSTQRKQRQVVFKMLREAELLTADNRIRPAPLTPRLIAAITASDPADLDIYPITAAAVREPAL